MSGSERYAAGPSRKEPIRRPRKACTTCRALKTRCLPDGDNQDPRSRCSRCARLNLECVYDRGRRAKKGEDTYHSSRLSAGPSSTPHIPPRPNSDPSVTDPRLAWKSVATRPPDDYRQRHDATVPHHMGLDPAPVTWAPHDSSRQEYQSYPALVAPNTFAPETYATSSGSIDTGSSPRVPAPKGLTPRLDQNGLRTSFIDYLEPPMGVVPKSAGSRQTGASSGEEEGRQTREYIPLPSPLDLGLVSEPEAQHLFHQFMHRIAPCSYLFDTQYHTYDRVCKSGILFSAILYASARFFRPDIEETIRTLTEHLISRSIMQGYYTLQLVQAICVMVYWKHPRDKTFYQKLGMASRLMSEMRYSWPTDLASQPPATSEEEERQRVDIERTVHTVTSLDLAYSLLLDLPPAHKQWMPTAAEVLEWAETHRHLNITTDFFKAFLVTFWELFAIFGSHRPLDIEDIARKMPTDVYQSSERRVINEVQRWSISLAPLLEGQYSAVSALIMKATLLKVRVVGFLRHLPSITTSLILSISDEISDLVQRLAEAGDIIYWSDLLSSTISATGAHLYTLRHHLAPNERRHATALCRKIADALVPTLTTGGESVLRYIERFYRNLSHVLEDLGNGAGGGDDPQIMVALQSLLQYQVPPAPVPPSHATAAQSTHPQAMQMGSAPQQEHQMPQQSVPGWLWPDMSTAPWMEHAPPQG